MGCSLEELSSSIFKHQHKGGTLQRSTSFRQGPEESGLGDGTGTLSPWAGDCHWEASSRAHCSLCLGETAGVTRPSIRGKGSPKTPADLALGREGAYPGGDPREQETQLMLLPRRPQTECTGVLRGHGVWPLQRALHPSCLSGEPVSARQEGPGAHGLPALTQVESKPLCCAIAEAEPSSTSRGPRVLIGQGRHALPTRVLGMRTEMDGSLLGAGLGCQWGLFSGPALASSDPASPCEGLSSPASTRSAL